MAYEILAWAKDARDLSSSQHHVLKELSWWSKADTVTCRLSLKQLSQFTSLSISTVKRVVADLVRLGLIAKKIVSYGLNRICEYTICGYVKSAQVEPVQQDDDDGFTMNQREVTMNQPMVHDEPTDSSSRTDIYKEEKKVNKVKVIKADSQANSVSVNEPEPVLFDMEINEDTKEEPKKRKVTPTDTLKHETIPEAWKKYCEEYDSELDPAETFMEFKAYWTMGRGAGTRRSERGWGNCWINWVKNAKKYKRNDYNYSKPKKNTGNGFGRFFNPEDYGDGEVTL